jgi:hypothetical protein
MYEAVLTLLVGHDISEVSSIVVMENIISTIPSICFVEVLGLFSHWGAIG